MYSVLKKLNDQNEEGFDYLKTEEESIIEKILKKQMAKYYTTMFEDVKHERPLKILLPLTDPAILKPNKFTDHGKSIELI